MGRTRYGRCSTLTPVFYPTSRRRWLETSRSGQTSDLMKRSFPTAAVLTRVKNLEGGDADAHVPFGGLGEFSRLQWEDFHPEKYLVADEGRARRLWNKIRRGDKAVIGLSWSSANAKLGEHKTARLADFSPLIAAPELYFRQSAIRRYARGSKCGFRKVRRGDSKHRRS